MMPSPVTTWIMLAKRVKPTKLESPMNASIRQGAEAASQLRRVDQPVCSLTMSRRFRVFAQNEVASASSVNT